MESLHKNIQLTLVFLKAPFLGIHFSYYTLMTFLMMLSVILLSMLMMLLSILSVIRHLICGNSQSLILNLNLTCNTLEWGERWFVHFNVGKTQLVSFDMPNNSGATDVKMDGSVLEEKSCFKILGPSFSSKLDQGSYVIFITKIDFNKIDMFYEVSFSRGCSLSP